MHPNAKPRYELSSEVLKSRRNLIIFSFVLLSLYVLAPELIEFKIAFIEAKISQIYGIKLLLFGAILVESFTFYSRWYVCFIDFNVDNIYSKNIMIMDRADNLCAGAVSCTNKECKDEILQIKLDARESHNTIVELAGVNFFFGAKVELLAPTFLISAVAVYSLYDYQGATISKYLSRSDCLLSVLMFVAVLMWYVILRHRCLSILVYAANLLTRLLRLNKPDTGRNL